MCTMWFRRNTGARMTLSIYGWFTTCAIVRFTAAVRLLEYVDCLSRCTRRLVRTVLRGRGDGDIISQPDHIARESYNLQ